MNMKVSRNDLCPCGSGKKYKKCCGANEAVSITHMLESEIDDLQKEIVHFALYHYGEEIQEDFEDVEEVIVIDDEQERELYQFVHAVWFTLFVPLEDGERIIEKFIASEARKIKRPKLRQILQSWTDARAIAGKVIDITGNNLTVEDGLTKEELEVVITNQPITIEKDSFFLGFILPFEQNYVFFPGPMDLPHISSEPAFEYIEDSSMRTGYESAEEYFADYFIEVMNELPAMAGMVDIDQLAWPAPIYQEAAEILQEQLKNLNEPTAYIDMGVILWFQFCQKRQKRIQNPKLYAAALHYLVSTIVPMEEWYSQKEIADLYGVSVSGISSIYRELDVVLAQEISELAEIIEDDEEIDYFNHPSGPHVDERVLRDILAEIEGEDFNHVDEINEFLNKIMNTPVPKKVSKGKRDQAQELIYDAVEADGIERFRLAKEALELNPNCSDAYVILAEQVIGLEDAAKLYEKGMQAGERELGKAFFKENKGYFWGLIETRPFMRAKFHYAETLYLLGDIYNSIKQYEELLELNPNDNQAVRYSLFAAYIDNRDWKKAREVLEQYNEDTTYGLYNQLLLEIAEHGFTDKAIKLLKDAKKQNKHVIDYLIRKKELPEKAPDFYGWGDENEAVVYADMYLHLWWKIMGIEEWLR